MITAEEMEEHSRVARASYLRLKKLIDADRVEMKQKILYVLCSWNQEHTSAEEIMDEIVLIIGWPDSLDSE